METELSKARHTAGQEFDAAQPPEIEATDDQGDPRPDVETSHRDGRGVRLAQGLGWYSLGIGLGELLVPGLVGRVAGLRGGGGGLMQLMGLREIATGLGLLGGRNTTRALDARIVGDVADLIALGVAFANPDNGRKRLLAATVTKLGVTALDLIARNNLAGHEDRQERVAMVTPVGKAITIDATAEALYAYWRDLQKMPEIMSHLRSVERIDAVRSKWTAVGPVGIAMSWESEIIEDRPGELISWTTVKGPLESAGVVRFRPAPGGRGTEVSVDMRYHVFGRGLGQAAATLFGLEPGIEVERGLRTLKQIFELGEPMLARAPGGK